MLDESIFVIKTPYTKEQAEQLYLEIMSVNHQCMMYADPTSNDIELRVTPKNEKTAFKIQEIIDIWIEKCEEAGDETN